MNVKEWVRTIIGYFITCYILLTYSLPDGCWTVSKLGTRKGVKLAKGLAKGVEIEDES